MNDLIYTCRFLNIFTQNLTHLLFRVTTFILLYMAEFILIFIAGILLSKATGKKSIWFLFLLIGSLGRTLYGTIQGIIFHLNNYGTLPSEMTYWLFESIAAHFIITPLVAWLGVFIGQKCRTKKTNIATLQSS